MNAAAVFGPGSVLGGDFKLIRPLAKGSMGSVYVAEQQSTGAERAIKLMHGQLLRNASARERFLQEAKIGAKLDSDHVVRVIGAGVDDASETPWIAMELLKGQDLGAMSRERGTLPPNEVLELFRQLCDGLGAAHEANIVHRDLKLENIFVVAPKRADSTFTVKILDFGVSKVLQEFDANLTAAVGSPMWMSPEQSKRGKVSPATDVWALGLIAFRLMTGRNYWKAAQPARPSVPDLLMEVMTGPIDPPSVRAREIGVTVAMPPGFDAWFCRCLVRAPEQRYQHATEAYLAMKGAWQEAPTGAAVERANVSPPAVTPDRQTGASKQFAETIVGESPMMVPTDPPPGATPFAKVASADVAPSAKVDSGAKAFDRVPSRDVPKRSEPERGPAKVSKPPSPEKAPAAPGTSLAGIIVGVVFGAGAIVAMVLWFLARR